MPGPDLAANLQGALSRLLVLTLSAAATAHFLGGMMNATVRNQVWLLNMSPGFSSAVFLRRVTGFGILCACA
eukprot:SAG31_NODE_4236_length_3427_cov_24.184574_5_plen_72_part_00